MVHAAKRAFLTYGDPVRVLATCAVVLIHVLPIPKDLAPADVWWYSVAANWTLWCVPVFFLLSGALLLDPAVTQSAAGFYRRRLWRIGVPVVFWSAFYLAFRNYYHRDNFTIKDILRELIHGEPAYHLWFVFALAGLYLVTPLLRLVNAGLSPRNRWVLALTCLGVSVLSQASSVTWGLRRDLNVTDGWAYHLGYFLLGPLIATVRVSGARLAALTAATAVAFCVAALGSYACMASDQPFRWRGLFQSYLSVPAVLGSVGIYVVFASTLVGDWTRSRLVSLLGTASFGVYLIHCVVIDVIRGEILADKSSSLPSVLGLWVATLAVSLAVVVVLLKVPYLGWVIGSGRPVGGPAPADRLKSELAAAGVPYDSTPLAR